MLKNLKIWQKLALIGTAFAIPILVLFVLLLGQLNAQVERAEKERRGAEYVLEARQVLKNAQEHRGATTGFLAGDATFRERAAKEQSETDETIARLDALDKKYGAELRTTERLNALKQSWANIKTQVANKIKPEDNLQAHNQFIAEHVVPLINLAAETSGLMMEPDLETHLVMTAFAEQLPEMNETLGQARALGMLVVTRKSATVAEKQQLAFLLTRARIALDGVNQSVRHTMQVSPQTQANAKDALQAGLANTTTFLDTLDKRIVNAATIDISSEDYFNVATRAIEANFKLGDTLQGVLEVLLQARVAGVNQMRVLNLVFVIVMLAVATGLILLVVQSITRPIAQLVSVTDRISLGELDAQIGIESRDEIGTLAESVARMQASLQAAIERLRARRAAA